MNMKPQAGEQPIRTVTCNGCFDGLHHGHMFFLGYCAAQGNRLIIGINSDAYISRHKREKPFFNEMQRKEALLRISAVHEVRVFNENEPSEFIRSVRPDIHCLGEEYRDCAPELLVCKQLGIRVVFVPRVGTWATSNKTVP